MALLVCHPLRGSLGALSLLRLLALLQSIYLSVCSNWLALYSTVTSARLRSSLACYSEVYAGSLLCYALLSLLCWCPSVCVRVCVWSHWLSLPFNVRCPSSVFPLCPLGEIRTQVESVCFFARLVPRVSLRVLVGVSLSSLCFSWRDTEVECVSLCYERSHC